MRATKAPPRGPIARTYWREKRCLTKLAALFAIRLPSPRRAPGRINGGAFTVPAALGNKIIHPYSDFLLHDIGTGDGIPVLPLPEYATTANQIRTAPLWALRTRNRLMHDGLSLTKQDAIQRHAGQGAGATSNYNGLSEGEKNQLLAFLNSL